MDSREIARIFAALLTAVLIAALSSFIADAIYPLHKGTVGASVVVVATEAEPAPVAAESAPTVAPADPAAEPAGMAALLAGADPAAGAKAVRKCTACHSLDKGGKNKIGPNLWDIIGRPIGAAAGYKYSAALKGKSGETWGFENLDAFLAKPKGWAPGTKMSFAGIKKPGQRANLIAYLRSLSDSPAALPE
jgi:cytochrome c